MAGFYEPQPEGGLRFGDIVTGFHSVVPQLHEVGVGKEFADLQITVSRQAYFAVMTPCCSIEEKTIALAALCHVKQGFFKNPYFAEDLTRINRRMEPQQTVDPQAWENMPAQRREKMLAQGNSYALLNFFAYAENPLLRRYTVHSKPNSFETGYYFVNFKNIFQLNCNMIERNQLLPTGIKLLQLSITARQEFRDKIAAYYARVPEEDQETLALI